MSNTKFLRIDIIVQRLEAVAEALQLDAELQEWFSKNIVPEAYTEALEPDSPCPYPPGSPQKIAALRKRWLRRLNLWNPDDRGFA
jgi:hypothetical protein